MYLTIFKTAQNTVTSGVDYRTLTPSQTTTTNTVYKTTIKIDRPTPKENLTRDQLLKIQNIETELFKAWKLLKPFEKNYTEQYYTFQIPKRSGGLRTINAPEEDFKEALSKVKNIFEQQIKCQAHPCAYAYVKQRSTIDALRKHKNNKSNWYLKIDLKDFFPNCTPELIFTQLKKLYPFYYISETADGVLKKIIKICCLDNGLPQGTPMSPLLTNLIMVPYDYEIDHYLRKRHDTHFVYTRYADDILISSKSAFDWIFMQTSLGELLQPFTIKWEKTRYGSKAGSNWNLGLMLNKDNQITIGHVKKKQLNAMLNNFLKHATQDVRWYKEDVYTLQGLLSHLKFVEPTYYSYILNKYETKYNVIYEAVLKQMLKA